MRWDSLFSDLEGQFSDARTLEAEFEISERARVEVAGIELGDRLRGALGAEIKIVLVDGRVIRGRLSHVGGEWLVLTEGARQWLLPYSSVLSCQGLGRVALKPESRIQRSLGIASALRALAKDRSEVVVHLKVAAADGYKLQGVMDRVGRDFFDLAVVLHGEVRRAGNVAAVMTIPFSSLAALCSAGHPDIRSGRD
ncbi:hypothetical protein [Arthrobacter sp. ISL-95]|uniref:hypothetical protein n=1 Tax=Arthrobacter sp. ISL-95 TaxID=2819116 RepID=UPI001BE66C61|nr:hypothetical protein [Arthrobacter sp. ISL-95]MBT2586082.1 hypothetical protein [Arthrobacter sp. ISL-95]